MNQDLSAVEPVARGRLIESLGWCVLVVFLILAVPIFFCMPVWVDVVYFGLHASNLMSGGVLGRELFFLGPPGMVWLQVAIRSTLGNRPEAVRAVDLLFAGCIFLLLARWQRQQIPRTWQVWLLLICCVFYLSTSEMCHCQPDLWMLLPTLGALELRRKQVAELTAMPYQVRLVVVRGLLEGVLWGSAFLIKPHIAVVAIVCYLISVIELLRAPGPRLHRLGLDLVSVASGGLGALGCWLVWLWCTGSWQYFWTTYQSWSGEYYSTHRLAFGQRELACLFQIFPWGLVNAFAVPVALFSLVRWMMMRADCGQTAQDGFETALLCGCYLAFLYQAAFIQFGSPYHLVSPALLGLTVLFNQRFLNSGPFWTRAVLAGIAITVAATSSAIRQDRLALWGDCWRGGSPQVYDRLALPLSPLGEEVDFQALAQVADFLRKQGIQDGELTCYHNRLIWLYEELGVKPSTRFLWIQNLVSYFPNHSEEVRGELARSRQRYLVTDLHEAGLSRAQVESPGSRDLLMLPPEFPAYWRDRYPWSEPIVFRSGRYLVHDVSGRPVGTLTGDRP